MNRAFLVRAELELCAPIHGKRAEAAFAIQSRHPGGGLLRLLRMIQTEAVDLCDQPRAFANYQPAERRQAFPREAKPWDLRTWLCMLRSGDQPL